MTMQTRSANRNAACPSATCASLPNSAKPESPSPIQPTHLCDHCGAQLLAPRRHRRRGRLQCRCRCRRLLLQLLLALQQRAQLLPHFLAAGEGRACCRGVPSGCATRFPLTHTAAAAAAQLHAAAACLARLRTALPAALPAAPATLPAAPSPLPLLPPARLPLQPPPLARPALLHGFVAGIDLLLQRAQLLAQRLEAGGQLGGLACRGQRM